MLRRQKCLNWIITWVFYFSLQLIPWWTESWFINRINLPLFFTVLPSNSRLFLSCRPFVVIQHFQQILWVLKSTVNCPSQETEVTSTYSWQFNLQERNNLLLDGRTMENKGKLTNWNLPIGAKTWYKNKVNVCSIKINCYIHTYKVTSTSTRPVDNVVITTKGLQDRNIHIIDGATVENKRKLIHIICNILI